MPLATSSPAPFDKALSWRGRLEWALESLSRQLLIAAILAIAGLTILNVLTRNLLNESLVVVEELCKFCVILVTFAGLSYAAGQHRHIRMTAMLELLPPQTRHRANVAIDAATSLLLVAMAFFAWRYVACVAELGGVSAVTRTPLAAVYTLAPLGFLLAALQYALRAADGLVSPVGSEAATHGAAATQAARDEATHKS